MTVRWTRRALRAVAAIAEYIAEDSPSASQRVVTRIDQATHHLSSHPTMGRNGRVAGTRELILPGLPFIVAYRVHQETVEILTVLHTSRKWPERL